MKCVIYMWFMLCGVVGAESGLPRQFIFMTSLYNELNQERVKELIFCLQENLRNPCIKKVHAIYDASQDADGPTTVRDELDRLKIPYTIVQGRPTFSFCFALARERYFGEHIILSNADILFDESISHLQNFDFTNKIVSLTRWEVGVQGGTYIPLDAQAIKQNERKRIVPLSSQDVWIFKSPMKLLEEAADLKDVMVGELSCDGFMNIAALRTGVLAVNPSLSVICWHIHSRGGKNWQKLKAKMHPQDIPALWCELPACTIEQAYDTYAYIQSARKQNPYLCGLWNKAWQPSVGHSACST